MNKKPLFESLLELDVVNEEKIEIGTSENALESLVDLGYQLPLEVETFYRRCNGLYFTRPSVIPIQASEVVSWPEKMQRIRYLEFDYFTHDLVYFRDLFGFSEIPRQYIPFCGMNGYKYVLCIDALPESPHYGSIHFADLHFIVDPEIHIQFKPDFASLIESILTGFNLDPEDYSP